MGTPVPKVLLEVGGRPLLAHVLDTARQAGIERILVIVGDRREQVERAFAGQPVEFVHQAEPRGTADAVLTCAQVVGADEEAVILSGDVPLLTVETLERLIAEHRRTGADLTLLAARVDNPQGYGRVIRDAQGRILKIVEERDASPEERRVKEMNVGLYAVRWGRVLPALRQIRPSPHSGEYYLTDLIRLLVHEKRSVESVTTRDLAEFMGVNTPEELRQVEQVLGERRCAS